MTSDVFPNHSGYTAEYRLKRARPEVGHDAGTGHLALMIAVRMEKTRRVSVTSSNVH